VWIRVHNKNIKNKNELNKLLNNTFRGNSLEKRNPEKYKDRVELVRLIKTISSYFPNEPSIKIALDMKNVTRSAFNKWRLNNQKLYDDTFDSTTKEQMEKLKPSVKKYLKTYHGL